MPLALMAFQGRLVAGVGKALRIYDIGKKKMLRKVENKVRGGHPQRRPGISRPRNSLGPPL